MGRVLQRGLKSPLACSPDLLAKEMCGRGPFIREGASLFGRAGRHRLAAVE